jgi:hypothetical protein
MGIKGTLEKNNEKTTKRARAADASSAEARPQNGWVDLCSSIGRAVIKPKAVKILR